MSRAFVKEQDDAPEPRLERSISTAPNKVTPRGARLIEEEVAQAEAALAAADYNAAEGLRRDLHYWIARRASAQLVEPEPAPSAAGFATRVRIRKEGEESVVAIVGEDEADPETGFLAWTSPLARALDEAEPGDIVEMRAGGRTVAVELLGVEPL
jgi:transcription elongation GreA/GreB family factor